MKLSLTLLLCFLFIAAGCRKKPDPEESGQTPPGVSLKFEHVVDTKPLVLNTGVYTTNEGDTFSIRLYKYYISNIKLIKADGSEYAETESYHLVDHAKDSSKTLILKDVPDGRYTGIKFLIGVDSARNVSGAQEGALNPFNDMFWDWNSGYIMAKIEGNSPQFTGDDFMLHMAGFYGPTSALRWVTLDLPSLTVMKNSSHTIHLENNVAEWFRTPHTVRFSALPIGDLKIFADNYADMFTVSHID